MKTIAIDEAKHAELAHDVAAWLDAQLTADERERIAEAQEEARRELERAAEIAPAEDVRIAAGVPGPAAARALVRGLGALASLAKAA